MPRRIFLLAMPFLLLAWFFVFGVAAQAASAQWTLASSTMPTARTGMSSVVIGNKIYVIGGRPYMNALIAENKTEVYDTVNDTWEIKAPPPTGRWGATAATVDGKVFLVAAGSPIPWGSQNLEEYNPVSDSWSQKAQMPEPGWGAVSAVVDGKIYVLGGYNWYDKGMNYNREYDATTNTWILKSPMPTKRSWLGAEAINGKIYVVGGWDENDINDLASLEVYDPKTDIWQTKAPMPKGLRGLATAVLDNKLYVMGGESGDGFNPVLYDNVLVYDTETDLWQEIEVKLPQPISVAEAQTVDGIIYLIGGYTYGQDLNSVYYWPEKPPVLAQPEPVILVPGIMGSWNVSGRWQIDPIFHTYDNLMEALIAAGYKENSLNEAEPTLFTFPYDWRQDNNLTASLLKQKIQQVKTLTGRDKVDIIAHSMGGLAARSYIQGSDYQNDIDQLIFLGTPHRGAVESYLRYEGAIFTGTLSWLQKYLFQTEAATQGYFDLTDYIRAKVLTVEQMLPVYDYLKDKLPNNIWQLRPYPLNYPQNNYLETLNSQVNIDLLRQRANITNIISDLGLNSTLNYLRVVADPDTTDNKWQNGYPENLSQNLDSLEMGNGDTTVPLNSANGIQGVETIETGKADHMNLPTVMQKEIIKTLTGKEPTDYFNNKITATIKHWAFFRVYSPVDFAVIAPDGRKIGKDFLNNTEINEIPDAFYSGFSDPAEFVLIPNPLDGEYKVEVQGVANGGEYTLANSIIDGDKEISKEYSGNILPAQQRDFTINYAAASENQLSDLAPVDTVSPVITINKPIEADKYLHSDNLIIDYTATDDFSGLATTTITIDGQAIATTTIDLFDYSLGTHNLVIEVSDKAGNQAQQQVNFTIITNIDSTIADIKKIYELGWLKDKIYHKLLKDGFKLLKVEAKYFDKEQELTEKLIKKTGVDSRLTDKQKQKLIEQYTKKLAELKQNRTKAINKSLDLIIKLLNKAKDKNQLDQPGYDIILSDVNYLRENL
ncbi:MAG: hypothetical protein HYV53_05000 [Parcubacteria group bacterium]|nr:hypothetical protein [Parcubacteria group bacterium]